MYHSSLGMSRMLSRQYLNVFLRSIHFRQPLSRLRMRWWLSITSGGLFSIISFHQLDLHSISLSAWMSRLHDVHSDHHAWLKQKARLHSVSGRKVTLLG